MARPEPNICSQKWGKACEEAWGLISIASARVCPSGVWARVEAPNSVIIRIVARNCAHAETRCHVADRFIGTLQSNSQLQRPRGIWPRATLRAVTYFTASTNDCNRRRYGSWHGKRVWFL